MTPQYESTIRLLAVILCVWNKPLRTELISGAAFDNAGNVIGPEWSKYRPVADALDNNDKKEIQGGFAAGANVHAKFDAIKQLFPGGGNFNIWVAPGPCPSEKTVNAIVHGIKASEGVT